MSLRRDQFLHCRQYRTPRRKKPQKRWCLIFDKIDRIASFGTSLGNTLKGSGPATFILALDVQAIRKARSRASGEYSFVILLMTLRSAQMFGPPENPVRFEHLI